MTKYIAPVTSVLVLIIAAMSFVLSYHALQTLSASNGMPYYLSLIWPLLIDFSLIVFSLCVVTAHVHGDSTWRQWVLVGLSTVATCVYNYLHAPNTLIAQSIAVVPPVMLFFSFELLMMQLKNSIKRQQVTLELTQELQRVTVEHAQEVEELHAEVNSPVAYRRNLVASMLESGRTQKSIASELDVSLSTVRSDMKALNGVLK